MSGITSPIDASQTPSEGLRVQRILIVTDTVKSVTDLAKQLRKLRYDVQLAHFDGATLSAAPVKSPAAIICHFTKFKSKSEGVSRILKEHYAPYNIPVIGVLHHPQYSRDSVFDSVIVDPAHASQIANRVNSLIRLGAMEREISLRLETLETDFGKKVVIEDDGEHPPFRILFIGKASPGFMVVVNALQEKNVEVVAAFTSFSAFDYLHEADFDAVVMNALDQVEPALSISETMRRNSRLFHVPTLFLVSSDDYEYADKAYESGARDIINIASNMDEISGRILELANYHRLHGELKHEFESLGDDACISERSGCYNHIFMDRHADRVIKANQATHTPISLLAIKLNPVCSEDVQQTYIDDAFANIGQMLKNLVRMQDTVAHYETDSYLLMLPDTNHFETGIALERIKALVDCTAFESGFPNAALTISIETAIVEVEDYETSALTIRRVMSDLSSAPVTYANQAIA